MGSSNISKYRNAVMGFAILWIMAFHSKISFSFVPILGSAANLFRIAGYGGVDVFLFVSGFGLYHSLSKKPDQLAFYKRRLQRLLPAYVPVLAVWLFLHRSSVAPASWPRVILGNLTGTSFWIGPDPTFNWYMPALFSFYFIAPFFFKTMERPRGFGGIIAATLVLDICFYGQYVMIAVTRFTIFAIGMAFGRRSAEERRDNRLFELFIYAMGVVGCGLLLIFWKWRSVEFISFDQISNSGLHWYPFIFIAQALTFLLCRLFSWMEHRAPWLLHCFEVVGKCSLEIYLIHVVAFEYIHPQSTIAWPFIYAVMILSGYVYHIALTKVLDYYSSLSIRQNQNKASL